jgi:hypothetical protein
MRARAWFGCRLCLSLKNEVQTSSPQGINRLLRFGAARRLNGASYVGCMALEVAHRRGKGTAISGMVAARKTPPMPRVTSTRLPVSCAIPINYGQSSPWPNQLRQGVIRGRPLSEFLYPGAGKDTNNGVERPISYIAHIGTHEGNHRGLARHAGTAPPRAQARLSQTHNGQHNLAGFIGSSSRPCPRRALLWCNSAVAGIRALAKPE